MPQIVYIINIGKLFNSCPQNTFVVECLKNNDSTIISDPYKKTDTIKFLQLIKFLNLY